MHDNTTPEAQAPAKKSRAPRIIGGVLGGVIVLGALTGIGIANSNSGDTATPRASVPSPVAPAPVQPSVPETPETPTSDDAIFEAALVQALDGATREQYDAIMQGNEAFGLDFVIDNFRAGYEEGGAPVPWNQDIAVAVFTEFIEDNGGAVVDGYESHDLILP
jgi:hypothetical protein